MEIRECKDTDSIDIYNLICELKNEKYDYSKFEIAFKNKMKDNRNYFIV